MDGKALVKIGDFSCEGQTRDDDQALDHDLGWQEKSIPGGIVDEGSAQLDLLFGRSYKTSDFIVDAMESKWHGLDEQEKAEVSEHDLERSAPRGGAASPGLPKGRKVGPEGDEGRRGPLGAAS